MPSSTETYGAMSGFVCWVTVVLMTSRPMRGYSGAAGRSHAGRTQPVRKHADGCRALDLVPSLPVLIHSGKFGLRTATETHLSSCGPIGVIHSPQFNIKFTVMLSSGYSIRRGERLRVNRPGRRGAFRRKPGDVAMSFATPNLNGDASNRLLLHQMDPLLKPAHAGRVKTNAAYEIRHDQADDTEHHADRRELWSLQENLDSCCANISHRK